MIPNDFNTAGIILNELRTGYTNEEVLFIIDVLQCIVAFCSATGNYVYSSYYRQRLEEFKGFAKSRGLKYTEELEYAAKSKV